MELSHTAEPWLRGPGCGQRSRRWPAPRSLRSPAGAHPHRRWPLRERGDGAQRLCRGARPPSQREARRAHPRGGSGSAGGGAGAVGGGGVQVHAARVAGGGMWGAVASVYDTIRKCASSPSANAPAASIVPRALSKSEKSIRAVKSCTRSSARISTAGSSWRVSLRSAPM